MKLLLVLIIAVFPFVGLLADNNDFETRVQAGIDQIYSIKFDQAELTFRKLMADYPGHPAGKFFIAMTEWWKILLDIDNEANDDLFFEKLEDVIFLCDEVLKKDPNNDEALFFKGGSIGFRGRLRAMRESWLKAADDGREALPIVHSAFKINPSNVDIQLGFGIYNYYADVIPEKFPFVKPVMVFFPKGEREKGIAQLVNVAKNGKYARIESKYFLMTLYYQFEKNYSKALEYAEELTKSFPDNPVFQRYKGRILVKSGQYPEGYKVFRDIFNKCRNGFRGYNKNTEREAAYYAGFNFKLWNSADSAIVFFGECEKLSKQLDKKEESGFLINSCLYLGMMNDLKDNREVAVNYYNQVLNMRKYGESHNQANRYLAKPYGK